MASGLRAGGEGPRARRIAAGLLLAAALGASLRAAPPQRVVSLVPAVTEMIFAMGAGDRLVGVSSFDRFPPEVGRLPRVGALLDPDVERILSLRPDLVVVYATQTELKQRLARARVPTYSYEHRTLADIAGTLRSLGERLGAEAAANRAAGDLERAIAQVRASVAGRPRPRTLLVFDREDASLRRMYASGGYGFLHDMIEAAGGTNVLADVRQQAVQASAELILARRPEVIIELRTGENEAGHVRARDLAAWNALPSVPAVRSHRVHVLVGQEFVVPGPRVALAIKRLAAVLHPEIAP